MSLLPVMRADKSREFYEVMGSFVDNVHKSVFHLDSAIAQYCSGNKPQFRKSANLVIDFETSADFSRRKLEKMLYTGVILPFGRGAKYELLESVDDIADKAELAARILLIEKIKISPKLNRNFEDLSGLVLDSVIHLKSAVLELDQNLDKAVSLAIKVENLREEARKQEFKLIEKLFSGKDRDINIILLKELITLIGAVADKAEESADRVISLAVKYQG
ncbi:TPA: DUF47 family protein [archaeon]|nr:DUF47 family protein [Candidatus Naiadarchaeales archaeon SRR2090159.bin1288]